MDAPLYHYLYCKVPPLPCSTFMFLLVQGARRLYQVHRFWYSCQVIVLAKCLVNQVHIRNLLYHFAVG